MKITAPINRVEEIRPLAEAGADEFYCSVVPDDWSERFRTSAVSRRAFGNLPAFSDLEKAISEAHRHGKTLSLVMNAQHYTGDQLVCLLELAEVFDELQGDAVIIGDESLLAMMASRGYRFAIHVSSIASCRNREAAAFHHDLGASRVILPRDMTLKEIENITKAVPELEFEAFVLNDGCAFEEGLCHTIHLPGKLGGPICLDDYHTDYRRIDGKPLSEKEECKFSKNDQDYQRWLWYRFGCGFSVTETGYPYGPCGLCALPAFIKSGITSVKICGRDAPTERKIKSVSMVSDVRDAVSRLGAEGALDLARGIRQQPEHCQQGYMCYYPEVRMKREHNSASVSTSMIPAKNLQ